MTSAGEVQLRLQHFQCYWVIQLTGTTTRVDDTCPCTNMHSPPHPCVCVLLVCVCARACVGVRAGVPICLCVCMSVCGCTYVREDVCACTGAQKRQNRRPPQQMTRCGGSSDNERYTYSPALGGGEALGLPASQLCCASSPIESTPVYAASASVSVCQSSQPLCRFLAL